MYACENCSSKFPVYMVWDELWQEAEQGPKNVLCPACLEHVLGRLLTVQNFSLANCNDSWRRVWKMPPLTRSERLRRVLLWGRISKFVCKLNSKKFQPI